MRHRQHAIIYLPAFAIGGFMGIAGAWWVAYEVSWLSIIPIIICTMVPTQVFKTFYPDAIISTDALGAPTLPIFDPRFLLITFLWNALIACALILLTRHLFSTRALKRHDRATSQYDY